MKINAYYLIVGVLSLLFAITHALNGIGTFLPAIEAQGVDLSIKTTSLYIWHIITIENAIFGVAFLALSSDKFAKQSLPVARIIAIVIVARWVVITAATIVRDFRGVGAIAVDSIAIAIYVGLIVLGIRRNARIGKRQSA